MSLIINNNSRGNNLMKKNNRNLYFSLFILFTAAVLIFHSAGNTFALEKKKNIMLNFKDAPVEAVLGYLSEAAGLVIVYDYSLSDRVSVISKQPLDTEEAVSLINTILREKGYTAVITGRTLKVVALSEAKKMNVPVMSGSNPDKIIPGDDIVTYIIPVRYAEVDGLKETLSSLISENADFSSNSDTNTLIITDTTANIKRLMEIIKSMDTIVATVSEIKVFHLEYAEAETTAELINDLFEEESSSSSSSLPGRMRNMIQARMPGGGGPPGADMGQSQSSSKGAMTTNINAKADERTNSVVVSAPEDSMAVIEKLITDLDSDSSEGQTVFVYPLKNARADNLEEVLTDLFDEMDDSDSQNSGAASQRGGGPGGGPGGMPGMASASGSSESSTGDLEGQVTVKADEDTNSLIIMTSPANYEKVKKVLDELDKPVPQVLIKVLLAEVTHDGNVEWGTEFSFLDTLGSSTDVSVDTDFGIGSLTSGYVAKIVGDKIDVTLRALEEEGKLNILSRPYILASNNQTASITVGNEVPFIRDSRTTDTGQTINTIEYEDIGIILEVTPYINDDGLVIMDLSQEISAISGESVSISETVDASVFAKRYSENRVIARDGQTVVIGGLMEDRITKNVSKVPLLGDIPILGMLFKSIEEDTSKTELLIFLTPTVAKTDKELAEISRIKKNESVLIPTVFEGNKKEMEIK
jgi:general secretion pathway protein D